MVRQHTPAHESTTRRARDRDGLADLTRRLGGAARHGAIAAWKALDPIGLTLAKLLHVVVFRLLQEINGDVRVLQNDET